MREFIEEKERETEMVVSGRIERTEGKERKEIDVWAEIKGMRPGILR